MAPSASPLVPASVTALFASGWPANHWPVCAPTVPMALLNPDTVQSASADAVGIAMVVAASPPSTPAARTPAIPRRMVLPDICIPHSFVTDPAWAPDAMGRYPQYGREDISRSPRKTSVNQCCEIDL